MFSGTVKAEVQSADLSEEGDWLLTHGVCIADVGLDDLSKRLLHSLQRRQFGKRKEKL